jgi:7-cyano-7-deazaguanine synthase in queuosine biosynthesis
MNKLLNKAIKTQIDLYKLKQPKDDFLFYVYNHPEAPYKKAYLNDEKVLLISGGMDSYMGYFIAKKKYRNVKGLYVDYGYPYAKMEHKTISNFKINCDFKDLSYLKEYQKEGEKYWGEIFPGRNWILCILAGELIKKRGEIWLMAVGGEIKKKWGDKSIYMLDKGSKILSNYYNKDISIETPFSNLTKGELVEMYLKKGGKINNLKKTAGCHYINNLNELPCGKCMGCLHRFVAMQRVGIDEKYKISKEQVKIEADKLYREELENPISLFSKERKREIKNAIK